MQVLRNSALLKRRGALVGDGLRSERDGCVVALHVARCKGPDVGDFLVSLQHECGVLDLEYLLHSVRDIPAHFNWDSSRVTQRELATARTKERRQEY